MTGCFFKRKKILPPRWELKPLSAGGAAAIESIENFVNETESQLGLQRLKSMGSRTTMNTQSLSPATLSPNSVASAMVRFYFALAVPLCSAVLRCAQPRHD